MNVLDFSILTAFATLISAAGVLLGSRGVNIGLAQSYSTHSRLFGALPSFEALKIVC